VISRCYCFTDSTITLNWILGVPQLGCCYLCSDKITRQTFLQGALHSQELVASQLWASGSTWLEESELDKTPDSEECLVETKWEKMELIHGLLTSGDSPSIERIMNYFSGSITSLVLEFCKILLSKVQPIPSQILRPLQRPSGL
jgi:hypothetical protein